MEQSFDELFKYHKEKMEEKLMVASEEFAKRAKEHDNDKLENKEIYDTYKEHFPKLKKIPFGTREYLAYEKENFDNAHQIHAQNRHHFYSRRNNLNDINLFDLMEVIIDISESAKQYGDESKIMESLKSKQVLNYEIEELIQNTIEYLKK